MLGSRTTVFLLKSSYGVNFYVKLFGAETALRRHFVTMLYNIVVSYIRYVA